MYTGPRFPSIFNKQFCFYFVNFQYTPKFRWEFFFKETKIFGHFSNPKLKWNFFSFGLWQCKYMNKLKIWQIKIIRTTLNKWEKEKQKKFIRIISNALSYVRVKFHISYQNWIKKFFGKKQKQAKQKQTKSAKRYLTTFG